MQYVAVEGNVRRRWSLVKDFMQSAQHNDFWQNVSGHLRQLTKNLIELSLDEEMTDYLHRQPYQRSDTTTDYRNGYYYRDIDSTLGPLEHIAVPRVRSGLFHPPHLRPLCPPPGIGQFPRLQCLSARGIHPRRRRHAQTVTGR